MTQSQVAPALAEELAALTSEQRQAATWPGDAVILAGPGSGKTRTIVARVAYLLQTRDDQFRGVACITYTNAAAREVRSRLEQLGEKPGRRLVSSTVHSFCLQQILRPFSGVAGPAPLGQGAVLDESDALEIWESLFEALGIADQPQYQTARLTRIRRALASDEATDELDTRYVVAAQHFERRLESEGVIDFEAMVSRALVILRTSSRARDSLVARFPHVVIDEYQDLGSVLHELVLELGKAGATVTAVGDADQTIFGFTGSDPKYLASLEEEHGFHAVRLGTNFRSGPQIIRASGRALGEDRGHRSAKDAPDGEVVLHTVEGDYREHGKVLVEEVQRAIMRGVMPHQIAVLYPRVGSLVTAVLHALRESDVNFLFEKDDRLPPGSLSRFIQMCATRLLAYASEPGLLEREATPKQAALVTALSELRSEAGMPALETFASRRALYELTDGHPAVDAADPVGTWLTELSDRLDLATLADRSSVRASRRALDAYEQRGADLRLGDLAAREYAPGKVVVTNYFQAKGREFDVVLLPGLVEREVPKWNWLDWQWRPPTDGQLAAQRREFYVAMTRARARLVLVTGSHYVDRKGVVLETRSSRFLDGVLPAE